MPRISKKKFWNILKNVPKKLDMSSVLNWPYNDTPQDEWLKGYRRWKKQQEKYVNNKRTNS